MTTKKKIFVAIAAFASAVVLVVVSVLATVAYLTSSAAVSNVFTIGNTSIIMNESKVTPEGVIVEGAGRVDTNTYNLVPNKTYSKDPIITVKAGSEASYLFVLVRNDIEKIEDDQKTTIAEQLQANGWVVYTTASTGKVYVYTGSTTGVLADDAQAVGGLDVTTDVQYKLFETFSIDPEAKCDAYGAAKITLTAVAIQTSGFGEVGKKTSLDAAWAAVIATYPYIHTGNTEQGGGAQA